MSGVLSPEVIAEFLERHRAERAAAGFPEHVEDPATLDRIASIVDQSRRENRNNND